MKGFSSRQLGQSMIEYTVVLTTAALALTVPLNGPGSNNVVEQIEQVMRDNYEGYSFGVTLSEMPDAISMEEALQMFADAGGDPNQLQSAGSMLQSIDDFLGTTIESFLQTNADFSIDDLLEGELPSFGDSEPEDTPEGTSPLVNEDGDPMTLDTVFIDSNGDIYELREPEIFGDDLDTPLAEDDVCTDALGFVRLPVTDTSTTPPSQDCTGNPVLDSNGLAIPASQLVDNPDGNLAVIGNGFVVGVDEDENEILLNEDDVIIQDGEIFLETEDVDTGDFSFP
ncbi:MAG: hypothetical protein VW985_06640 [Gammaproteobacteria bacterium]